MKVTLFILSTLILLSCPIIFVIKDVQPTYAQGFIYDPHGSRSYTMWYNQLPSEAKRVENTVKAENNAYYSQYKRFLAWNQNTVNYII